VATDTVPPTTPPPNYGYEGPDNGGYEPSYEGQPDYGGYGPSYGRPGYGGQPSYGSGPGYVGQYGSYPVWPPVWHGPPYGIVKPSYGYGPPPKSPYSSYGNPYGTGSYPPNGGVHGQEPQYPILYK